MTTKKKTIPTKPRKKTETPAVRLLRPVEDGKLSAVDPSPMSSQAEIDAEHDADADVRILSEMSGQPEESILHNGASIVYPAPALVEEIDVQGAIDSQDGQLIMSTLHDLLVKQQDLEIEKAAANAAYGKRLKTIAARVDDMVPALFDATHIERIDTANGIVEYVNARTGEVARTRPLAAQTELPLCPPTERPTAYVPPTPEEIPADVLEHMVEAGLVEEVDPAEAIS